MLNLLWLASTYKIDESFKPVVYVFNQFTVKSVDLRQTSPSPDSWENDIPHFGLRGVVQEGGLVFGDISSQDMRKYISHTIELSPLIWNEEILGSHSLNQASLFPSRKNDNFYKVLLEQCQNKDSEYHVFNQYIPVYD